MHDSHLFRALKEKVDIRVVLYIGYLTEIAESDLITRTTDFSKFRWLIMAVA